MCFSEYSKFLKLKKGERKRWERIGESTAKLYFLALGSLLFISPLCSLKTDVKKEARAMLSFTGS